ncbi:MAG: hypothetical protein K9G58_05865 [Bacteroidales bacterium]|nr:hypothetical protein [Bacteroidales bacterium]MCF8387180.1 hypothetical protein [Bacteroidales bacterium]MCF8397672.1 hypothetical protein [Bacteroidales bacterium]
MKFKIYKTLVMLIIFLLAVNVNAEEIIGISDPFLFGSAYAAPLSDYALYIGAVLIGGFLLWRYFKSRKSTA